MTTVHGVDTTAHPDPDALYKAGKRFLCQYIGLGSPSKHTDKPYVARAVKRGIHIVINGEEWGGSQGHRDVHSHAKGVSDAKACQAAALLLGYPEAPIYFSVDYDVPPKDKPLIGHYFDGIASVIGLDRVGAYGGYWIIKWLFDHKKITWGWQAFAWSGGNIDPRAHLYQHSNGQHVAGVEVDLDRTLPAAARDGFGCVCHTPKKQAPKHAGPGAAAHRPLSLKEKLMWKIARTVAVSCARAILFGNDVGYFTHKRFPYLVQGKNRGLLDRIYRLEQEVDRLKAGK